MTAQHAPGRLTLRKLIELVRAEFMDAELSVTMKDAHRNSARASLPVDLWSMPRIAAHPATGEPARLAFEVWVDDVRFVKVTKPTRSAG
ncbi:hypothetical protein J2W34_000763 [Variovorax boronicumulans]|uniref:hypothetical protein n=1 Tax=Variovorax boronicumulans TaxID=436515 RepID=UPI00277DC9A1|nr:hypothetical protein [Variovorax boronicumulans]MDQ0068989.1 hypothetical protein [Variovorax boronicumulans]